MYSLRASGDEAPTREVERVCRELERYAVSRGARAALVAAEGIYLDERVRLKCQAPVCPHFNRHLLCPPNFLTIEEAIQVVRKYSLGFLVQVKAGSADHRSTIAAERELHELINALEREAMARGFPLAVGLIASSCKLCEPCVGVSHDGGCRFPLLARPSAESMCIDMRRTAAGVGLPVGPGPDELAVSGILLIK